MHEGGCRRRSSRSPVPRGALPRQGPGRVPHSHAGTKQTLSVGIRTHLTCPASRKVHLKTALPAERPAEGVGGVDSTHAPRPAGHPSQEFSPNLRFPLPACVSRSHARAPPRRWPLRCHAAVASGVFTNCTCDVLQHRRPAVCMVFYPALLLNVNSVIKYF